MSALTGPNLSKQFMKFHKLIANESDRGAVILTASILDSALEKLLKAFLLPPTNKSDELFNSAYSPIGSFSAKIELSYRLGLINSEVKSSLSIFKSMRNDFAHRLDSEGLDDEKNKNRMLAILKCTPDIAKVLNETIQQYLSRPCDLSEKGLLQQCGCRGTFNILFSLTCSAIDIIHNDVHKVELQFSQSSTKAQR